MGGSLRLTLISELQASERSCSKEVGGFPENDTGGLHMQEYFSIHISGKGEAKGQKSETHVLIPHFHEPSLIPSGLRFSLVKSEQASS